MIPITQYLPVKIYIHRVQLYTIVLTSECKKFVPNIKGDIGMEVYHLCQPNTYVIAREFGEQQ